MKMKVALVEHNISNGAIRLQISKSTKDNAHYGAISQDFRCDSISNFVLRRLSSNSRKTTFEMMLYDSDYQSVHKSAKKLC